MPSEWKRLTYIFNHLGGLFHSGNILVDDGLATEDGIFNEMNGARLRIVENYRDSALVVSLVKLTPFCHLAVHDVLHILDGEQRHLEIGRASCRERV